MIHPLDDPTIPPGERPAGTIYRAEPERYGHRGKWNVNVYSPGRGAVCIAKFVGRRDALMAAAALEAMTPEPGGLMEPEPDPDPVCERCAMPQSQCTPPGLAEVMVPAGEGDKALMCYSCEASETGLIPVRCPNCGRTDGLTYRFWVQANASVTRREDNEPVINLVHVNADERQGGDLVCDQCGESVSGNAADCILDAAEEVGWGKWKIGGASTERCAVDGCIRPAESEGAMLNGCCSEPFCSEHYGAHSHVVGGIV